MLSPGTSSVPNMPWTGSWWALMCPSFSFLLSFILFSFLKKNSNAVKTKTSTSTTLWLPSYPYHSSATATGALHLLSALSAHKAQVTILSNCDTKYAMGNHYITYQQWIFIVICPIRDTGSHNKDPASFYGFFWPKVCFQSSPPNMKYFLVLCAQKVKGSIYPSAPISSC